MAIDCPHWLGFELAAERHENAAIRVELNYLKSKLADIAEIAKDVDRPPVDFARALLDAQHLQMMAARQIPTLEEAMRMDRISGQSGIFAGIFGGLWP